MADNKSKDKNTAIASLEKKPKNTSSKKKRNAAPLIVFGNPDLKVVVRLLPPTLTEIEFLHQAKEISSALSGIALRNFYYHQGTRKVNAFEEPIYSRAYFEFRSIEVAQKFKNEMRNASFFEPESGDQLRCDIMKSIFGEVAAKPTVNAENKGITNEIYEKFVALRDEGNQFVNLKELIEEFQASQRESKKKLRRMRKKKIEDEANVKDMTAKSANNHNSSEKELKADDKGKKVKQKKKKVKPAKEKPAEQKPKNESKAPEKQEKPDDLKAKKVKKKRKPKPKVLSENPDGGKSGPVPTASDAKPSSQKGGNTTTKTLKPNASKKKKASAESQDNGGAGVKA